MVKYDEIEHLLDDKHFPLKMKKADIRSADTGRMVDECKESPNSFSVESISKIDLIQHEDDHYSTMTSKKEALIEVISDDASERSSFQPSIKSKGSSKKAEKNPSSVTAVVPKQKKDIEKKKKDERKNVCHNCFKFIVKEFLSPKYYATLEDLSGKNGIESEAVREYYEDKLSWNISLSKLRTLLNFKDPNISEDLKKVKLTFHSFFVFYMRRRYNSHILSEKKIEHKHEYFEAKRYLMYLPDIKPSPKFNKHLS